MKILETGLDSLGSVYQPMDIILNLAIACALGLAISLIYKRTHKGLSYSQSFMLTIVFVTVIVALVMMVIGNNLARAFALVGALSIIRFRTVIKDTKDTAYIFLALAVGMAAGTSSYALAVIGAATVSALAVVLHLSDFGSLYKSEFILRFRSALNLQGQYGGIIEEYTKSASLLHSEPSADGHQTTLLTFDVTMMKDVDLDQFLHDLNSLDGISEVMLIASKGDVDY
jgi:uncharacterized membrane protein YhiD involved in acid resistance